MRKDKGRMYDIFREVAILLQRMNSKVYSIKYDLKQDLQVVFRL